MASFPALFSAVILAALAFLTIKSTPDLLNQAKVTSESTYPRDEEFFVGGKLAVNGLSL